MQILKNIIDMHIKIRYFMNIFKCICIHICIYYVNKLLFYVVLITTYAIYDDLLINILSVIAFVILLIIYRILIVFIGLIKHNT